MSNKDNTEGILNIIIDEIIEALHPRLTRRLMQELRINEDSADFRIGWAKKEMQTAIYYSLRQREQELGEVYYG